MVSTRNHPRQFPPPELSPVKGSPARSTRSVSTRRSTRNSSAAIEDRDEREQSLSYSLRRRTASGRVMKQEEEENDNDAEVKTEDEDDRDDSRATSVFSRDETPVPMQKEKMVDEATPAPDISQFEETTTPTNTLWSHTPSFITLGWLAISLPLVIWDSGYVLGRPHTMPGGKWHWPFQPYALYGTVDYFYGWPAIEEEEGWTGAQGMLNVIETSMYLVYLWIIYKYGRTEESKSGRGAPDEVAGRRKLSGRYAAIAVLIAFSAALMTLSKTVLYCEFDGRLGFVEYCSVADLVCSVLNDYAAGFRHTRHNDWSRLIVLWMIPK